MTASPQPFLVVGPPRGGFTLLLSVLALLYRDRGYRKATVQEIAHPYIGIAEKAIDGALREWLGQRVGGAAYYYSKEFSILTGGPKWIPENAPNSMCVRKYLGIKGVGDLTFLLHLPRWVLSFDDIVHSHNHPATWSRHVDYACFLRFASIRNPIDIIHSSVFSINALASEYIQRELKIEEHMIRRELGLNKLSNLQFVEGLVIFLKRYLDEFVDVAAEFDYVMRWEDLIQDPIAEIQRIAVATRETISADYAATVWSELDHRNLTRYHRHSFRRGVLNDWQLNITNSHLRLFQQYGFNDYLDRFGYPRIKMLDESSYTAEQQLIEEHIRKDVPYQEKLDADLITFAFNKTNFANHPRFPFKHYPRQGAFEIEKSTLRDESIAVGLIGHMSEVTHLCFEFLEALLPAATAAAQGSNVCLEAIAEKYVPFFTRWLGPEAQCLFESALEPRIDNSPPRLLGDLHGFNIVLFRNRFLAVPQALGPIDLSQCDPAAIEGILIARSYDETSRAIIATGIK